MPTFPIGVPFQQVLTWLWESTKTVSKDWQLGILFSHLSHHDSLLYTGVALERLDDTSILRFRGCRFFRSI